MQRPQFVSPIGVTSRCFALLISFSLLICETQYNLPHLRKLLVAGLLMCFSTLASAQLDLNKAAAGFDVKKLTQSIMTTLTSKVGLSTAQVSAVTQLISQFLTKKSSIMPLAKAQPAEYQSKFEAEQKTLFDKLKGSVSADQFTKFLNLKPKKASSTDAISQLFF